MAQRVCPWWLGYFLASPIRRLWQNPRTILAPFVREGMTVLEPGPGMGFFTLELARLVGTSGRVVAIDVQGKMLDALRRRAARAGLLDRLDLRLAAADSLGVSDLAATVDIVLAFAVVHEMPSPASFFAQSAETLKLGGELLLAEPAGHVKAPAFEQQLELAHQAGLIVVNRPEIRSSLSALLRKPQKC